MIVKPDSMHQNIKTTKVLVTEMIVYLISLPRKSY
jgi:hypothetical protein